MRETFNLRLTYCVCFNVCAPYHRIIICFSFSLCVSFSLFLQFWTTHPPSTDVTPSFSWLHMPETSNDNYFGSYKVGSTIIIPKVRIYEVLLVMTASHYFFFSRASDRICYTYCICKYIHTHTGTQKLFELYCNASQALLSMTTTYMFIYTYTYVCIQIREHRKKRVWKLEKQDLRHDALRWPRWWCCCCRRWIHSNPAHRTHPQIFHRIQCAYNIWSTERILATCVFFFILFLFAFHRHSFFFSVNVPTLSKRLYNA